MGIKQVKIVEFSVFQNIRSLIYLSVQPRNSDDGIFISQVKITGSLFSKGTKRIN